MKKTEHFYVPHLTFREYSVAAGTDWLPKLSGWSLIQIKNGSGYWLQANSSKELETGSVLFVAGSFAGTIRASQLNTMALTLFTVIPQRLIGLITLGELNFLNRASSGKEFALRVLAPNHPVAAKMHGLGIEPKSDGLMLRIKLLELFVESLGDELRPPPNGEKTSDAKERLETFLRETPPDELLDITFKDLARKTHCTSRHLSRIFNELIGMSFREKRAEIRLARACELLATSKSKVVEVAMESGYKSLSLFNLMFTRRFGTSPGKWRQKQANPETIPLNRNRTKAAIPSLRAMPASAQNRPFVPQMNAKS
jgi:AraC-like DNA-binding protein